MSAAPLTMHLQPQRSSMGSSSRAVPLADSGATFGVRPEGEVGAPPAPRLGRKERMAARARMAAAAAVAASTGGGAGELDEADHSFISESAYSSGNAHPSAPARTAAAADPPSTSSRGVRALILSETATGMHMGIEEEMEDELDSDDLLDEGAELAIGGGGAQGAKGGEDGGGSAGGKKKGRLRAMLGRSKGKRKDEERSKAQAPVAAKGSSLPSNANSLHQRTPSIASQQSGTTSTSYSRTRPPPSILQNRAHQHTQHGSPSPAVACLPPHRTSMGHSRSPSTSTNTPAGTYGGTASSSDRLSRASSFTSFTASPALGAPLEGKAEGGVAQRIGAEGMRSQLAFERMPVVAQAQPPGPPARDDLRNAPTATPLQGRVIDYGMPPQLAGRQDDHEATGPQSAQTNLGNATGHASADLRSSASPETTSPAARQPADSIGAGNTYHMGLPSANAHPEERRVSGSQSIASLRGGSLRRQLPPAPPPPAPNVALPPVPASPALPQPPAAPQTSLPSKPMTFVDPLDGKEYAIPPSMLAALLQQTATASNGVIPSSNQDQQTSNRSSTVSAANIRSSNSQEPSQRATIATASSEEEHFQPSNLFNLAAALPAPFVALAPPLRSPGGTLLDLNAQMNDHPDSTPSAGPAAPAEGYFTAPAMSDPMPMLSGKSIVLGSLPNSSEHSLALSISTTASASGASQREGRRERLRRLQVQLKTADSARNVREDIKGLDIMAEVTAEEQAQMAQSANQSMDELSLRDRKPPAVRFA